MAAELIGSLVSAARIPPQAETRRAPQRLLKSSGQWSVASGQKKILLSS
jgi:hypothetical protein